MIPAYYMQFQERPHGASGGVSERVGGLPTHLPATFPVKNHSGDELAFLAQFYCTPSRLNLSGVLCVQLYQDPDVGAGGDPCPTAVLLPLGNPLNDQNRGVAQKG